MQHFITFTAMIAFMALTASSCDEEEPQQDSTVTLTLTAAEKEKVGQDNLFAFELFKQSAADLGANENGLLSPVSLTTALAMASNGARGTTREAIYETLRFGDFDALAINEYYQKLIRDLPKLDFKTSLDIANSIWYKQDFSVAPDFLKVNSQYYHAQVEALDFADPAAPDRINAWVKANTHDKIPSIIDQISQDMVMYLINAIYFKGDWAQQFDKSKTTERNFIREGNSVLETDFMHINENFGVYRGDEVEAVELPYGDNKYSMVIVKSSRGLSPAQVLDKLTGGTTWNDLTANLRSVKTNLWLPKFKFSFERQLKDDLTALGMGLAFSDRADFTGIQEQGNLTISEVKQKAFIEVNEEGTEAAAATSVGITVTSMPQIYEFDVNHPFLFIIREVSSGLILFVGQVNDPSVEHTEG